MTTTPPGGNGSQDVLPGILDRTFDDFLAQAEHELLCRRREMRALRRRARHQRRRELNWWTRAARLAGRALPPGTALAGTVAFVAGVALLLLGHAAAAKDAFGLSAAAWAVASTAAPSAARGSR
ncbi:hypothetical protein [Streptomyces sp. NPDC051214]|uniref:hypothetical protein n=1 Tax=Streptomyces sp. NPDC051214 TaxID=3155282 RepID=UPI00341D18DD